MIQNRLALVWDPVWALLLLIGCAGHSLQTQNLKEEKLGIPESSHAEGVKFVKQKKDHCGPSALSSILGWAKADISPDELEKEVMTPGAGGTYQLDILSAIRSRGLLALEVSGMEDLLRELGRGRPVLVFQNLGFDWYELWHYSVVTGYELNKRELFVNNGVEENERIDFEKFERGWRRGGYWGVMALAPNTLAASSGLDAHLKAAAALEKHGKDTEAVIAYRTILRRWPKSHWAWFALGNLAYKRGELSLAQTHFLRSSSLEPGFPYVWHNYAILLHQMNQKDSAAMAAKKAMLLVSPSKKELFGKSLSSILKQ